ncbi:MAG: anti-sigma factor [Myxococcales bacterium]|nr:anti-sigma factor [Myxococcales bacterium]
MERPVDRDARERPEAVVDEPWSPAELDALEDALAELREAAPASAEPASLGPRAQSRLADYRRVLALFHDATPLEDPSPGVLDGVLAAARAATPPDRERGRDGLLGWLRRSWALPGLALATSAALVLILVRPGDPPREEPSAADRSAAPELADARAPAAPAQTVEVEEVAADEDRVDATERTATVTAQPSAAQDEGVEPARERPPAPRRSPPTRTREKKADAPSKEAEAANTMRSEPQAQGPRDKDSLRDALDRADRLRERGHCDEARPLYAEVAAAGGLEGAFALVGLGVCAELRGAHEEAERSLRQARETGLVDDARIARERAQTPRG